MLQLYEDTRNSQNLTFYKILHNTVKFWQNFGSFVWVCVHVSTFFFLSFSHSLSAIAKHFKFGRQEDAHEFLRYFVDALQRAALHHFSTKYDVGYSFVTHPSCVMQLSFSLNTYRMDPYSKHTTVIHQIFGGYHRSQGIAAYTCTYSEREGEGFPMHVQCSGNATCLRLSLYQYFRAQEEN